MCALDIKLDQVQNYMAWRKFSIHKYFLDSDKRQNIDPRKAASTCCKIFR